MGYEGENTGEKLDLHHRDGEAEVHQETTEQQSYIITWLLLFSFMGANSR